MYPYSGLGLYIQCPIVYRQFAAMYNPYLQMRSDQYAAPFFSGIDRRIFTPGVTPDVTNEQKLKEIETEAPEVLIMLKDMGLSEEAAELLILRIIELVNR
ncbi:hypothetical protein OXPF_10300 [Oxobacter pfennigii]|uniref:Uncharacterized protein n=1 Tax=Oxobacter pfennigii TaxID=36849 RepID=A0A0P8WS36_9CLOT|nr:hypothetical protein [Oxobacter pfennigii]KPU45383.1 hypothetical protein OXPF_10300 [Oxobacter pfennigii]